MDIEVVHIPVSACNTTFLSRKWSFLQVYRFILFQTNNLDLSGPNYAKKLPIQSTTGPRNRIKELSGHPAKPPFLTKFQISNLYIDLGPGLVNYP